MNGSQRFVFGSRSKHVVSEKALKEANAKILPKSSMAAGDANEKLNAVYEEKYEEKLMCPITNEPFGRPVLFYPETSLEKERAAKWNSAGKSKTKKKKRKAVEVEGDLTIKSRTTTSY